MLARPRERSEVERSSLTLLERLLMLSSQLLRLLPEPEPLLRSDALPLLLLLSEPRLHLRVSSEDQPLFSCDSYPAMRGLGRACLAQEIEQAEQELSFASKRCTRPISLLASILLEGGCAMRT